MNCQIRFLPKYTTHGKMKLAPLNSSSKFASTESFFVKNNNFEIFTSVNRDLSIIDLGLTFNLLKNVKRSPEPSRYELSIAAFRVYLRPLVSELAGGNIYLHPPPSATCSSGDTSDARVKNVRNDLLISFTVKCATKF